MLRDVYVAIADPTRRQILDFLKDRDTVSAGEIASRFQAVSRPAVSRHLRILRECGVVVAVRHGRSRNYALDPTQLNALHHGWLQGFARRQATSLRALREIVEAGARDC